MSVVVQFFQGKQMHTSYNLRTGFHDIWEYPEGMEETVKDDVEYTVVADYDLWDFIDGLTCDYEGCKHVVKYIEEKPDYVTRAENVLEGYRDLMMSHVKL